jgi:hypothetical protein
MRSTSATGSVTSSALHPDELEERETLGARGEERELHVTAAPLHDGPSIDAPPLVVAVFLPG